jgi:uncharacterized membrane protein
MDFSTNQANQSRADANDFERAHATSQISSLLLRGGVILSAVVIAIGLILFLITGQSGYTTDPATGANSANPYIDFHENQASPVYFPTNPVEIWQGLLELKPFAIIMLGLLLLVATPVLNIATTALTYFRYKDWAFTGITLFVLAMLVLSFFLGKAGG